MDQSGGVFASGSTLINTEGGSLGKGRSLRQKQENARSMKRKSTYLHYQQSHSAWQGWPFLLFSTFGSLLLDNILRPTLPSPHSRPTVSASFPSRSVSLHTPLTSPVYLSPSSLSTPPSNTALGCEPHGGGDDAGPGHAESLCPHGTYGTEST